MISETVCCIAGFLSRLDNKTIDTTTPDDKASGGNGDGSTAWDYPGNVHLCHVRLRALKALKGKYHYPVQRHSSSDNYSVLMDQVKTRTPNYQRGLAGQQVTIAFSRSFGLLP